MKQSSVLASHVPPRLLSRHCVSDPGSMSRSTVDVDASWPSPKYAWITNQAMSINQYKSVGKEKHLPVPIESPLLFERMVFELSTFSIKREIILTLLFMQYVI